VNYSFSLFLLLKKTRLPVRVIPSLFLPPDERALSPATPRKKKKTKNAPREKKKDRLEKQKTGLEVKYRIVQIWLDTSGG
jgi:hypothetical protein